MSRTHRAFEYDTLRVGSEGLSDAQFLQLVRFNERAGDRFFTVRHRAIRFNSYVGVLRVGTLTLEILPKADRSNDESRWRSALVSIPARILQGVAGGRLICDSPEDSLNSTGKKIYCRLFVSEK